MPVERARRQFANEADAGRWLLEGLGDETPEYMMLEWLSRALVDSEAAVARYFHYDELGRRASRLIHDIDNRPVRDVWSDWLANHYYLVVNGFCQSMVTNCFWMAQETGLSADDRPRHLDSPDYSPDNPEFALDAEEVRKMVFGDRDKSLAVAKEHELAEGRIYRLCGGDLKALPEEMELSFRVPLYALASAHRNIAFCANFGQFMHGPWDESGSARGSR